MCDAPEYRRPLRTCISALSIPAVDGKTDLTQAPVQYILYTHCVWDEQTRPAVHLLNCPHYGSASNEGIPILMMCSYCKDVMYPAGSTDGEWINSMEYYARCDLHGEKKYDVLLSHTVCTKCYKMVLADLGEECDLSVTE